MIHKDQQSDPIVVMAIKAVICKDQQGRQLPLWRVNLTRKYVAMQAPAAPPQIMKSREDRWTHCLDINLAQVTLSHIQLC